MQDLNYIKKIILEHSIQEIQFEGWKEDIITKSLTKNNIDPGLASFYFPGGLMDIFTGVLNLIDEQTRQKLADINMIKSVRQKIQLIIETRLECAQKYKFFLKTGLTYYLLHGGIVKVTARLFSTCDNIWHLAADKSVDFNYYTKRLNLAYVYITTLMFWFEDKSPNNQETTRFIESRLSEVLSLGSFIKQQQGLLENLKKLPFVRLLKL